MDFLSDPIVVELLTQVPISISILIVFYLTLRSNSKQSTEAQRTDARQTDSVIQLAATAFETSSTTQKEMVTQLTQQTLNLQRMGSILMKIDTGVEQHEAALSNHEVNAATRAKSLGKQIKDAQQVQGAALNVIDGKLENVQGQIKEVQDQMTAIDTLFQSIQPQLTTIAEQIKGLSTAQQVDAIKIKVTDFIDQQAKLSSQSKPIQSQKEHSNEQPESQDQPRPTQPDQAA